MDLKLIDDKGQASATVAGSDTLFARDYNEALIHQLVTAFQANGRMGTRKQKARSEINSSHAARSKFQWHSLAITSTADNCRG